MTRTPNREPISKVDTAWLRMEHPCNLMMITGVIGLDEAVSYERLVKTMELRFLAFRRFRQKAVDGTAGAFWEEDAEFDMARHVRRVALPGQADRAELEKLAAELASTPLDKSRPLWQFHLVENYQAGPVIIVRIHHCIADGIALVQVFLSLTDESKRPRKSATDSEAWIRRRASESPIFKRLMEPAKEGLDFAVNLTQRLVSEGLKIVQDPGLASHYANEATEIVRELSESLALPNDPRTRFKGTLGTRKAVVWAEPLPLEEVKAVSKAFGCTVNDVLIAAVSAALRRYLVEHGESAASLQDIRATVPVNLRPLEHALELGNHFGLVFLSLPLEADNPLDRLYQVNERMNELKTSRQAAVTFGLLSALGMGPSLMQKPLLDILSEKASTILTNVPGPQKPLYFAGSKIREMMFWVPQSGRIGLGISILSYNGQVFFGLMADHRLVPDPHRIIDQFKPEFEKLLYLALMLPVDRRPERMQAEGLLARAIANLDTSD